MASISKRGKTWQLVYDGRLDGRPRGSRAYIYGLKSRKLAVQAKGQKDTEEQLLRAGLHIPSAHAGQIRRGAGRSIDDLAEEFRRSIVDRGKKGKHALIQASHVKRLCKMAKIQTIGDLAPAPIQSAARRLIDDEGLSPRTANAAIKAARQFSTWLYSPAHYAASDLLHRALDVYNEELDERRPRREPSVDEFTRLVGAAESSKRWRCGLNGTDRAMLFRVAVGTGFRQAACLSLTRSSFRVAATLTRPSIVLGAKFNKNGKEREQPIRRDLASVLRDWLDLRDSTGRVWQTSPHASLELLVKRDLETARKAWLDEASNSKDRANREESSFLRYQDHAGRYFDFHSLRHMGISLAVRSAGLKAAQVWADHSTPVLTAKYAHMDLADEARVLDALPATDTARHTARQDGRTRKNAAEPGDRKIG